MKEKLMHEKMLCLSSQKLFFDPKFENKLKNNEINDDFLIKRDYKIRLALPHDIDSLMMLEKECWSTIMQIDQHEIESWIQHPACFVFVLEYQGRVIGVNYAQRIDEEDIKKITGKTVAKFRKIDGEAIQLIALNMLPLYQDKAWGNELLEFVLQYTSIHPNIKKVYAITRCRDFYKSDCLTMQEYFIKINKNGILNDPILKFHQMHGANILGLIENYRTYDTENHGYGVLLFYDIKNRPWNNEFSKRIIQEKQDYLKSSLLELICQKLNTTQPDRRKTLKELGLDSLDHTEILVFIHEKIGVDISINQLNSISLDQLLKLCRNSYTESPDVNYQPLKKRIRNLIRQYPEIVPLTLEGNGPCTFWIHPLSGDVGIYNNIAVQADATFKMIAIQSRGFMSRTVKPLTTISDMAKYYCQIITAIEPEGPYNLIGFSLGGTIAYEMVSQLQTEGRKVEKLLLVEAPIVEEEDADLFKTDYRNNLLMNANFLLLALLNMETNRSNRKNEWSYYNITNEHIKNIPNHNLLKHIVSLCKQKGLKQTNEELEFKLLSMSNVHLSNLQAIQKYRAEKIPHPTHIKAWLFRTKTAQAISSKLWNPDYLECIQKEKGSLLPMLKHWEYLLPNIQTIILEGDNHFDILHSDNSIKRFYTYCKNIFIEIPNEPKKSRSTTFDIIRPSITIPIAIVGMSGRFPDAENIQEFWENLKNGRNCIKEVPSDRGWNIDDYFDPKPQTPGKTYSRWGAFLRDIDKFDSLFFKIPPREAELIDPSERLFIQEAWKAIEDAGYNPKEINGKSWGVFACAKGDYHINIQKQIESYYLPTDSYSAGRLSYLLNLKGPAMTIDTACSSTLSVVVEACNSLVLGECEAAIAGGGAVYSTPNILISSSQSLLFSPNGQCFAFDQRANGTVASEAIGAIILKRLDKAIEDNDHIYGVIRGWGLNQDGKTNGITAPSGLSQSKLQTNIYDKFNINPEDITMFEAHGTGTQLGDAVEFQAITNTFRKYTSKKAYCALGSVKTNIGHAFFGSGIASLIKILLSIKNASIPPILNYKNASSKINIEDSPFFINTKLKKWETQSNRPRCAAINAFGATGTNAHLVIEEYISQEENVISVTTPQIIVLSAKYEERLKKYAQTLLRALEYEDYNDNDLYNIAYTLQIAREHMKFRLAILAVSIENLKDNLKSFIKGNVDKNCIYCTHAEQEQILNNNAFLHSQIEVQKSIEQWLEYNNPNKLLEFWVNGVEIDWKKLYRNNKLKRISLPTYPFSKDRCWINNKVKVQKEENYKQNIITTPVLENKKEILNIKNSEVLNDLMVYIEDWEEVALNKFRKNELKTILCFLSDAENQKLAIEHLRKRNQYVNVIFISQGEEYRKKSRTNYFVHKTEKTSYEKVFKSIQSDFSTITAALYLWPYEDKHAIENYRSIVFILQAIASQKMPTKKLILGAKYSNDLEMCYLDSWIGFERSIGAMISETRIKVVIEEGKNDHKNKITEEELDRLLNETEVENNIQSVLYKEGIRHEYKIKEINEKIEKNLNITFLKNRGTYLITGGLGKLGLIFAKYLAQKYNANLILTGRSTLNRHSRMFVDELEELGGRVFYIESDICEFNRMKKGLEEAKKQFKEINGVIHAAGIVEQKNLFQKDIDEFEKVINPKIEGTLILDQLLKGSSLDFVCYFSSLAAVMGDFGACDYAVANRFQMAYARYKNKLKEKNYVLNKTFAINWPLWREGGMGLASNDNMIYLNSTGQRFLEKEEAVFIFEQILTQSKAQILVIAGQKNRINNFLKINKDEESKVIHNELDIPTVNKANSVEIQRTDIILYLEKDLKEMITQLHGIDNDKLSVKEQLIEYGFDSINLLEFSRKISKTFGLEITPSLLLSYSTIEKIVEYLIEEYRDTIFKYYFELYSEQKATTQSLNHLTQSLQGTDKLRSDEKTITEVHNLEFKEPIAIIGMSGRFPQADTISSFWENLKDGKNCVSEIPIDRWNWQEYYGNPHNEKGKSYSKWGGFLTNIDNFDPLFFNISPKEAHIMDPAQRLFLEEAWHALEDAGYMGQQIKGKACGVYVGVEEGEYGFMARQAGEYYSNQNAILSARIANILDLKGPNMSITASCSSGLVALHQACNALHVGDCEIAIAGGINLLVSPVVHSGMSLLDLLSPSGNSYVFDNRADGLVPSEAVAVVVLKPLSSAIRDRDQIYGCIKGSGVNNNGSGLGLMAPNPLRQSELLTNIFEKYNIDPINIKYIISHSVGTKLGDAAEIEGLKKAFGKYTKKRQFCYIGSVKPLIGHTFAASGIVSLITMLMAMKNNTILKLHNYQNNNEDIHFSKTPFITNTDNLPWITNTDSPRLGATSTSSNSGTNAFIVIEEYLTPKDESSKNKFIPEKNIFVFSATDKTQLLAIIKQFVAYIDKESNQYIPLSDIAYTLQIGRKAMAFRLAIIAQTRKELLQALKDYIKSASQEKQIESLIPIFTGNIGDGNSNIKASSAYKNEEIILEQLINDNNLELIAIYWTKGENISFETLKRNTICRKVSLPGYPFKKEKYWLNKEVKFKNKICRMDKSNILQEKLIRIFSENLDISKQNIDLNKNIQEYGVGSILAMKLVREIEATFQIDILARDFVKNQTINKLIGFIEKRMSKERLAQEPFTQENISDLHENSNKEYLDPLILDAMEKYTEGVINLNELEKIIGVN